MAGDFGNGGNEPDSVDHTASIWLASPLHVVGVCVNRIGTDCWSQGFDEADLMLVPARQQFGAPASSTASSLISYDGFLRSNSRAADQRTLLTSEKGHERGFIALRKVAE
ncbi:hypothetical protein CCR94_17175 [Rhodoblastus sphagnicola]|uniref:Uncharacterized protein n=2 Tax=Rhodoblastus sphagnicola TaxID=333368 RepID=A0A2S6N205_9HYPH|nr:hypothetical protein CCR94_17175 [Rhodoblastus sphagnicola]